MQKKTKSPKVPKLKLPIYWKVTLSLILINLGVIVLIILIQNALPPVIPLFFGKPRGTEQLTAKFSLLIPPVLGLISTASNLVLSELTSDTFINKILTGLSIALTTLSTITVIKIILLIGNI